MKSIMELQGRIQKVLSKINNNPQLLNVNQNETGNIENIITASQALEQGDFRSAIDEIQEVINELNGYAADLMNQVEHKSVESRYPEGGPKKYEQE